MFGKYPSVEDKVRRAIMESEFVRLQADVPEYKRRAIGSVIEAAVNLGDMGIPVIVKLTDEFQTAYNVDNWVVASDFVWHCNAELTGNPRTLDLPF